MRFAAAVEHALEARDHPVITLLDLYQLAQDLLASGDWQGEPLQRPPARWDHPRNLAMISKMVRRDVLKIDGDFPRGVYRVLSVDRSGSAEEVACLVDPHCYVAYGSAMRLHGWKAPAAPLHLVAPTAGLRRTLVAPRLAGLSSQSGAYGRIRLGPRLRRRAVLVRESAALAPTVERNGARLSAVGATFADMLAEPRLCGGMGAVLKVWDRHARAHLEAVVAAVSASPAKIVKVRAGHILTERLGVETPQVAAWQVFAQRGGSRRLDPDRPYAPTFSARWMLSLNAEPPGK